MLVKVLRKGRELYRYSCNGCGQVELHDRMEDVVCSNCGEVMRFMSMKTTTLPKRPYEIGEYGQAGIVFYDKGYYSDGWRYLECASADLRVDEVNGNPTVDSRTVGTNRFPFGFYRTSTRGKNQLVGTDTAIGSGKANTEKLVDAMKDDGYEYSSGRETTANYAARLCQKLEHLRVSDWFLPSKDELDLMYKNLKPHWTGLFANDFYWSSSESGCYVWSQNFLNGGQFNSYRDGVYRVRPVRRF